MKDHLPKCTGPDKEKVTDKTIFLSPDEVKGIREALGLLNSMVTGGERHSPVSEAMVKKALESLEGK